MNNVPEQKMLSGIFLALRCVPNLTKNDIEQKVAIKERPPCHVQIVIILIGLSYVVVYLVGPIFTVFIGDFYASMLVNRPIFARLVMM